MSVTQLLSMHTALELEELIEFWKLEPFGDEWEQSAMICETIASSAGMQNVDRNTWRPVKREKPKQTKAEMKAELAKVAAFFKRAREQK